MNFIFGINFVEDTVSLKDRKNNQHVENNRISSFMITRPDTNEDKFCHTVTNNEQTELFAASDGKRYNIREYISQKLWAISSCYEKYAESKNIEKNNLESLKARLGIKTNEEKFKEDLEHTQQLLSSEEPIKNYFQELTGKAYNSENLELFLRGQIKLLAETAVEELTNSAIQKISPAPIYENNNSKKEMQSKKIYMNNNENEKYQALAKSLDNDYQNKLEKALKSGKLLAGDTDNKVVLDSLYNVLTKDRVDGIDKIKLIQEAIDILDNPYIITQYPADIPEKYQTQLVDIIMKEQEMDEETASEFLNKRGTGTCAAAAFEYELATEHTAEFFKIIDSITSKEYKFEKELSYTDIAADKQSAIELLEKNNTEYKENDENSITVTLRPDKNAIIRARIQNYYHDAGERSMIDVLLQSTIMNLGSRGTYDSLSDTRKSHETYPGNGGLSTDEILYAQSILTNGQSEAIIYKNINSKEWKLGDRNASIEETKDQILQLLNKGKNVVIGITMADEENNIVGGHETTIIGYTQNLNGDNFFILQDSDDGIDTPTVLDENMLLSQIQHSITKK